MLLLQRCDSWLNIDIRLQLISMSVCPSCDTTLYVSLLWRHLLYLIRWLINDVLHSRLVWLRMCMDMVCPLLRSNVRTNPGWTTNKSYWLDHNIHNYHIEFVHIVFNVQCICMFYIYIISWIIPSSQVIALCRLHLHSWF